MSWNVPVPPDTIMEMTATLHRIRDLAARIRRLQTVLRQFDEGRRRLELLHSSADGAMRVQVEQVLALNLEAIEARRRDLEALQLERARLQSQPPDEISAQG